MFWQSKKKVAESPTRSAVTFEQAKEATRRAAFLNTAQGMTADEGYRQHLTELFHACRTAALKAGEAEGRTQADVDAAIGALCDADAVRLKKVSDEEFRTFATESGEVVKRFLAAI